MSDRREALVARVRVPVPASSAGKMKGMSWVYFIEDREAGAIKIGVASDPERRRKALQTCNPRELTIRRVIRGAYNEEWRLHYLFRPHRIRGEWFHANAEVLSVVDRNDLEELLAAVGLGASLEEQLHPQFAEDQCEVCGINMHAAYEDWDGFDPKQCPPCIEFASFREGSEAF